MKKVIMYETNGKRFDKYSDAEKYEKLCKKIKSIMAQLLPRTDKVERGEDYNKHNINTLRGCYMAFLKVMKSIDEFEKVIIPNDKVPFNNDIKHNAEVALYHFDECERYPILHKAMYRFQCICFENCFEFDQPYWVYNQKGFFIHLEQLRSECNDNKKDKEELPF